MELFEALRRYGVSDDVITKIWREFSGIQLYISKYPSIDLTSRNAEIKRLYGNGMNPCDIARRFNLSYQWIMKIRQNNDNKNYSK